MRDCVFGRNSLALTNKVLFLRPTQAAVDDKYKVSLVQAVGLLPLLYCVVNSLVEETTIKWLPNWSERQSVAFPTIRIGDSLAAVRKMRGFRIDYASSAPYRTVFLSNFLWKDVYLLVVNCDQRQVNMIQFVQLAHKNLGELNDMYQAAIPNSKKESIKIDDLEVRQKLPNPAVYKCFENNIWAEIIYSATEPSSIQQVSFYKEK
ncbi:MAG: hypothetical protein Q8T09_06625 [Candidatus Melainabacteria bacterium]|nr:hypothetical protein [Candidatus Melainabacteria bacterium]